MGSRFLGLQNAIASFLNRVALGGGQASAGSASTITVPAAPTLSVTPGTGQNTLIFADGPNGGAPITAHNLYRGTASGAETLVGTILSGSPYVDTGLTNGVAYYYRLSAINAVGEGPLSAEASGTPISTTLALSPIVVRSGGAYLFTATRSGDTSSAASIPYTVAGVGGSPATAADFGGAFPTGTANFAAGSATAQISVPMSPSTTAIPG
jgi:hypothetical protein